VRIHLLHTNDVHSQLENYIRIGNLLRITRSRLCVQGEPVLTFDVGDVVDRIRPETEVTGGQVNAALMGALGYDGWVFGNNEGLTIPVSQWRDLVQTSGTTVFGTNIRTSDGEPLPYFEDCKIYDCQQIRVGVFGLTADYDKPYEHLNARVLNPIEQADCAAEHLRQQGCHVVVLLSHLGLREDRKLASQVHGIDVILGGHSHEFMEEAEFVNGTAIYQCGKHALAFGHTIVEVDESTTTVQRVVSKAVYLDVHGPFDAAMMSEYQKRLPLMETHLNAPVLTLKEPLAARYDGESTFGNLLVDALFDAYPADLGLMMTGALTASLMEGQVRFLDVHAASQTPTRPLLLTMSGADIRTCLEKAVTPAYFNRKGYGYGFRGSVIGCMAVANAQARTYLSATDGQVTIQSVIINGQPLVDSQRYRVVTCEYLWLSPVFEEFHRGYDVDIQPPLVRELLMMYMRAGKSLELAHERRYVPVADLSVQD
jgi:5'-nucleotidase